MTTRWPKKPLSRPSVSHLSSFFFFFPSLRSSEGKRVSYSSYAVKYAICASQSMSEFWVNPHEYVTLSAWINKTCSLGNWGAAPLTNEDTICKWDFFFGLPSFPSPPHLALRRLFFITLPKSYWYFILSGYDIEMLDCPLRTAGEALLCCSPCECKKPL